MEVKMILRVGSDAVCRIKLAQNRNNCSHWCKIYLLFES